MLLFRRGIEGIKKKFENSNWHNSNITQRKLQSYRFVSSALVSFLFATMHKKNGFRFSHIIRSTTSNHTINTKFNINRAFSTQHHSKNYLMATETFANELLQYLNDSCTAFHAVEAARQRLLAANFTQVSEAERWELKCSGKYFFTRNTTTIVAFTVGGAYEPGNGFTVAGAHTDRLPIHYCCRPLYSCTLSLTSIVLYFFNCLLLC